MHRLLDGLDGFYVGFYNCSVPGLGFRVCGRLQDLGSGGSRVRTAGLCRFRQLAT